MLNLENEHILGKVLIKRGQSLKIRTILESKYEKRRHIFEKVRTSSGSEDNLVCPHFRGLFETKDL